MGREAGEDRKEMERGVLPSRPLLGVQHSQPRGSHRTVLLETGKSLQGRKGELN